MEAYRWKYVAISLNSYSIIVAYVHLNIIFTFSANNETYLSLIRNVDSCTLWKSESHRKCLNVNDRYKMVKRNAIGNVIILKISGNEIDYTYFLFSD